MIVCLCYAVSDRKIKEMASQGASIKEIVSTCQVGTGCGACTLEVKKILEDEKQQARGNSGDA